MVIGSIPLSYPLFVWQLNDGLVLLPTGRFSTPQAGEVAGDGFAFEFTASTVNRERRRAVGGRVVIRIS
jgi:hypothetical protein